MKTTPKRENELNLSRQQRKREYTAIYKYWIALTAEGKPQIIDRVAQTFNCSRQKVFTAISYMLKFEKY